MTAVTAVAAVAAVATMVTITGGVTTLPGSTAS